METVGSNRYHLLFMDDDSETQSTTKAAPKKKAATSLPATAISKKPQNVAKKTNSAAEKENKASALNKEQAVKKEPPAQQNQKKLMGRNANDDNLREQRNRRNFRESEGTENTGDRQQRQFKDRENRPPRNNREGFYRGKREFDRQSGSDKTGVKAIDKRDGAGAHNWGSVKQDIEDVNIADPEISGTEKYDSATEQLGEAVNIPEEEEAKEMTLDEWKALTQREKPKYNIRKPGEGEDVTQWKKMIVLNKKKENSDSEEELEYDPSMYPQRVGRLQRIVDIQFNFNDGRRKGGNYGGRGRGGTASRRSGGGDKGRFEVRENGSNVGAVGRNISRNFEDRQKSGSNNLKVDYENQFPTLS